MRKLFSRLIGLRKRASLTPEQAEVLSRLKFPCC